MAIYKSRLGMLMSCCLATLNNFDDSNCKPGDIKQCDYSEHPAHAMILSEEYIWEWGNAAELKMMVKT